MRFLNGSGNKFKGEAMRAKLEISNIAPESVAFQLKVAYSYFRYIAYILAVRRIV